MTGPKAMTITCRRHGRFTAHGAPETPCPYPNCPNGVPWHDIEFARCDPINIADITAEYEIHRAILRRIRIVFEGIEICGWSAQEANR